MLQRYISLTLAAVLSLTSLACGPRDSASGRASSAGDSASGAESSETARGTARKVGELKNFQNPESVRYDSDLDVWFVSNVNGDVTARDNNGYISRLKSDGTLDTLKFIAGGKKGTILNGPKGMTITGDTLWVADIDALRGFNKRTGAVVAAIKLPGAKFLNDVAPGPGGKLYITDTGVAAGAKGLTHPGPDRIYAVAGRKTSVALETPKLAGPNGITWTADEKEFVIVPFFGKDVFAWKPGEKTIRTLGSGAGQLDGVEALPDGRLLVTSWVDSSLFVLDNGRATTVATGIPSPADIGFNSKTSRVAVPLLMENRVEFWDLP